jgi:hypothetical protein
MNYYQNKPNFTRYSVWRANPTCDEQAQRVEPFRPFDFFAEIRGSITFKSLL